MTSHPSPISLAAAERVPRRELRRAMNAAFADYAVPMRLSPDAFELMMRMRGLCPASSRVALDESGAVSAFWLVGRRGRHAYLIASGTVPSARRRGLSRRLGVAAMEALASSGAQTLRLEVLTTNRAARALYAELGFFERRHLDSYDLPGPADAGLSLTNARIAEREGPPPEAPLLWDVSPSWQNATEALIAAGDAARVMEHRDARGLAAYLAVLPGSRAIVQLAVRADRRREGHAAALLAEARVRFGVGTWRAINLDRRSCGVRGFLDAAGAVPTVSQKELLRRL